MYNCCNLIGARCHSIAYFSAAENTFCCKINLTNAHCLHRIGNNRHFFCKNCVKTHILGLRGAAVVMGGGGFEKILSNTHLSLCAQSCVKFFISLPFMLRSVHVCCDIASFSCWCSICGVQFCSLYNLSLLGNKMCCIFYCVLVCWREKDVGNSWHPGFLLAKLIYFF